MFHWHSKRDVAAAHIVWDTMEHRYVFEWLLGVLSINTWVKLLIRMQMTELFGPQFKVIGVMAVDLIRFYILWFIILTMLTSLACLVFMLVLLTKMLS